jgi:hypothetical protein
MENNYLEFSKQLRKTEENRNYNNDLNYHQKLMGASKETFNFYMCSEEIDSSLLFLGRNYIQKLIKLDNEDIEYFKNKYLPKINDQFQDELEALKLKFNKDGN